MVRGRVSPLNGRVILLSISGLVLQWRALTNAHKQIKFVHVFGKRIPSHPRDLQAVAGEQHSSSPSAPRGKKQRETGTWAAASFLYPITGAEFQAAISLTINLVPYLAGTMHHSISESTKITNNFTGTCYILTVVGGFFADSYLGTYWTIAGGSVITALGLGLLTFTAAYQGLRPAECTPTATTHCSGAGVRDMAPLYVALYTIALGTGAVRPNTAAIGADQFDGSSDIEKEQGVRFFVWFYFFTNLGLLVAFTLGVYIQDNVGRGWGYGFSLALYLVAVLTFFLGSSRFRHKPPSGSFLTRIAQVVVASLRKLRLTIPDDTSELYNAALPGSDYLHHTSSFRQVPSRIHTSLEPHLFMIGGMSLIECRMYSFEGDY
ncbi:hypothetical protein AXG93_3040s1340 [Marchantia polymorpha subsp. ruderalis]|uniref:Major facilitator superfamily (MFS) profile domain-containing protein n=1 Tax=Marchantia polymorpha subsp. ruderalis TaxID=1480154 RepID=A0A176W280_MARPO|nr:hypothetical protein AXG93_3040s1340 [Marchantia polymorpha subsp. ruderalis]